jgi:hypothetical protein
MPDADIALAKKRLAWELRIIVVVQVVGVFIYGLGFFLRDSGVIPNYPAWDVIHSLCGVFTLVGICAFIVAVYWGSYRLMVATFLPIGLHIYGASVWILPLLALILASWDYALPLFVPLAFLCYVIIPQFFISRWLAKAAEEGITENEPRTSESGGSDDAF